MMLDIKEKKIKMVRNILKAEILSSACKRRRYVSWYGSKKTVFRVGVAPNAPGCSTLHVLTGKSLAEMKQNFELRRDKEFASHVCAEHPRAKSMKR
jgi:hypothetical protein